jgi:hypothetical protein
MANDPASTPTGRTKPCVVCGSSASSFLDLSSPPGERCIPICFTPRVRPRERVGRELAICLSGLQQLLGRSAGVGRRRFGASEQGGAVVRRIHSVPSEKYERSRMTAQTITVNLEAVFVVEYSVGEQIRIRCATKTRWTHSTGEITRHGA